MCSLREHPVFSAQVPSFTRREKPILRRKGSDDRKYVCCSQVTGSEDFSLLICIEATKFVLLSVVTLIETICPNLWAKPLPKNSISPLLVNVRRE